MSGNQSTYIIFIKHETAPGHDGMLDELIDIPGMSRVREALL